MSQDKILIVAALCLAGLSFAPANVAAEDAPAGPVRPVLAVRAVEPRQEQWTSAVAASGWIAAWDEASISTEIGELRIEETLVDVGDAVKKGQVLARLSHDAVEADLRRQEALVASAEASLEKAMTDADRARRLLENAKGAMSQKDIEGALSGEKVAKANLGAEQANLDSIRLKLEQTTIRAIDDGVVSQKSVTLGAVPAVGTELFRLIRQNRIEWHAEIAAKDLPQVVAGQQVRIFDQGQALCSGSVRTAAPTADRTTGRATIYVDLPTNCDLTPGSFASGSIEIDGQAVTTVPSTAVTMEGGASYVYRLTAGNTVERRQVTIGRRRDGRVEVVSGLDEHARLVGNGGVFLFDGAPVRVVAVAEEQK
ncbi:efflux RND transporter periplasmic adaptor subunit [Tropicimonas sp. IMCC34043]|uniref:efflux RND transporter periplasmic adaptor subunit n=1 Tax=Tropicimonas sp. IMCC34043 TaxID=2248760 RepID=UPI000E232B18|nr:efflux RND transporter periplasmic adaptor subunit [Tropicimonas sp. IMCC34043]